MKDPLRKERLIARGKAMVRDLYDRRREVLQASIRHLAEENRAMPANWRHEPENACPFCHLQASDAHGDGINDPQRHRLRTPRATAFILPRWWPNNKGHVLMIR